MKRLTTLLLALMLLAFASCKKDPVETNEGEKVRVSCTVTLNDGCKSDFTNLMDNGSVNWSEGKECIYVAIPGATPKIIELEGWADGNPSKLEFEGEAAKDLISDGTEYDIWYFGHSQQLDEPYVELTDGVLTGSIANQSGRLEDLGYCHIAKTKVTAETINGEVVLNLNGTLQNQIAIALLDLNNVSELYGNAIKGTEYKLQYNADTEKYELAVTEGNDASISVESAEGISYVVLFPNETKESKIKCRKGDNTYAYTFHNGIKGNKVYYRTASDGTTAETLTWSKIQEIDGYEYVDLGLPSGLKWATCNVGADNPEDYGNYYAWGETATKSEYTADNSLTYGRQMNDISGNVKYDVAAANWGGSWRMPTKAEIEELLNYCTVDPLSNRPYKLIGPNGNEIIIPTAGGYVESGLAGEGTFGYFWSSTPMSDSNYYAYFFSAGPSTSTLYVPYTFLSNAIPVRPVSGGNFEGPAAQYAFVDTDEVSEITTNSAVCGGNVTTDNGSAVTAKGVCWSTSQNPTIEDNKTTDGTGLGSYTSNLTNLEANTTYYVRAYATNAVGTSYGKQKSFTTLGGYDYNGHEYVDLGLPSGLKWATCNVGADNPEDYGNYYAWGETATKSEYTEDNSLTYGLSISELQAQGIIDGNNNLTPSYDAATANWGGDWRMPTKAEQQELRDNCTWILTTQNGVNGYKVTGTNGNSIFLPAAGDRYGSSLIYAGETGNYWSSTPYESNSNGAYRLFFSSAHRSVDWDTRYRGRSVRPVSE